jgi:mannose-1-phosphate guanylyltransferase/mannose-6-phosphate isomerase
MRITPVILAGGVGERLWPLSKPDYPKQFICVDSSGRSLLQHAVARVSDRTHFTAPVISCHHEHRFTVAEHLRVIGIEDATIILEPQSRNTAPALLLAALHQQRVAPDGLMLALPSDHRIADVAGFLAAIATAKPAADAGSIVVFSAKASHPETAYGYIQCGAPLAQHPSLFGLAAFVEKPSLEKATAFLAQGDYGWNSGMFLMRSDALITQYESHAPDMHRACKAAFAGLRQDMGFLRPDAATFAASPAIAFDVAIMERTDRGVVLPIDIGWGDVGSWRAVDAMAEKSTNGNAAFGNVQMRDVENSYIFSNKPIIAALGVRDLVVVAADDAVLIADKNRLDEMKPMLQQMERAELLEIQRRSVAHRPWGKFYAIDSAEGYHVKRLHIKPHAQISLQTHTHRSEHWVVVQGTATVQRGDAQFTLTQNQSIHIAAGERHRLQNLTDEELIVIEVQTGDVLEEGDIVRHEDIYQRDREA